MSATTWYVARSAGIVAYLLLSTSVVLGVLMAGRAKLTWPRFAVQDVHRFLAILTGVFLVLHGGALLADRVVPIGLTQILVPFTSTYRPFAVGLGVVAAELLAAVAVSNALRKRLRFRHWRRIHYLTIAVWLASTGHALLSGTDRRDTWFIALVATSAGAVALAFLQRLHREAAPGAIAATGLAAGAAVLALAVVPQGHAPRRSPATVTAAGVPASFSAALAARVEQNDPVVSVVGIAGGAGVRLDLLVDRGIVRESALQLRFPSGASCSGTVTSLDSSGASGSCGTRAVRIAWQIQAGSRVVGRVAVGRGRA
jgi:methionine sulfoxide reductase heme-binding subunit